MAGEARKTDQRHNGAFVAGSILGGLAGAAVALWKAPQTGEELRGKLMGGEEGSRRVVVSGVGTGSRGALGRISAGAQRMASGVTAASQRVSTPDPAAVKASVSSSGASLSNRVMSLVERATAPIVGVKLGKTANGSGPAAGGNAGNGSSASSTVSTTSTSSGGQVDQSTATRSSSRTILHSHGDESVPDRITFGTYSGRSSGSQSTAVSSEPAAEPPADATVAQSEGSPGALEDATPSPASQEIPQGVPGHVPTTEELVTPRTPFVPDPDRTPPSSQQFPSFPESNDDNRS